MSKRDEPVGWSKINGKNTPLYLCNKCKSGDNIKGQVLESKFYWAPDPVRRKDDGRPFSNQMNENGTIHYETHHKKLKLQDQQQQQPLQVGGVTYTTEIIANNLNKEQKKLESVDAYPENENAFREFVVKELKNIKSMLAGIIKEAENTGSMDFEAHRAELEAEAFGDQQ